MVPDGERVSRLYFWVSIYYNYSDLVRTTHDPALLDAAPLPYPEPPSARPATLDLKDPVALEALARFRGPRQCSTAYRLALCSSKCGTYCWTFMIIHLLE